MSQTTKLTLVARSQPDYEPEDEEALQDDEFNDESLLNELSRAIHGLFKGCRSEFLPYFDRLLPAINTFLVRRFNLAFSRSLCSPMGPLCL